MMTKRTIGDRERGDTLATGESGAVAQLWNLDVNSAINRICQLANGALTSTQWTQYISDPPPFAPPCPGDG